MKRRIASTLAILFASLALPAAGAPSSGPHRMALPAPALRLDGDSLEVPM
jgi:hypothetical protein